jgi:hypothetical protein
VLSAGTINHSAAELVVELIEPANNPSIIRITWPARASIIPPSRFNQVAADLTRLIAAAATAYTQIKAQR